MLKIENISKSFGEVQALSSESFEVQEGEIFGLIGQNGAGKTTTFRIILGLMKPDQGFITFNNQKVDDEVLNQIGYLPEERGLFPKMKIEDQVVYLAELKGQSRTITKEKIDEYFEKFEIKGKKTDKLKSLSKGNQQKVQLMVTLIHDPKYIIFDEPFSGLDPVNAQIFRDAILEEKKKGKCIIFSSHNMDNVDELSDQLIMLKNGKVILDGTVKDVRNSYGRIKVFLESQLSAEDLEQIAGIKELKEKDGRFEITLNDPAVGKEILTKAQAKGNFQEFSQQPLSLDEIFKIKAREN
ncbi:ABC transporter ATP-binding protein [Xylocopilactobacillus apicola]|uniref:Sodium ABC transporter ATP-binding protein n=1 Tax=Xylocopilactobacillus apicola TaxID=2932184 RepID=A0AAU9CVV1_9LACO|nr:ATP-binding cassette domain-containing protein [Xylocopilactobacillus apicola]BDR58109.1 sodium ABC transporter ATP-binding protein [Xylocopilactobacillus apicola]